MAYFHEYLEYHEDTKEKRELTNEDLDFLIALQKEMNTQDTVCQADPRFWVIKGSKQVFTGEEYGEEMSLLDSGNDIVVDKITLETFVKWIQEEFSDDLDDNNIFFNATGNGYVSFSSNKLDFEKIIFDVNELLEEMQELEIIPEEYQVVYYNMREYIYPDTMFLTQKAAAEHLKKNYYHYSNDAHTFAMTSWRSPETEKLWEILEEIDFEKLRN